MHSCRASGTHTSPQLHHPCCCSRLHASCKCNLVQASRLAKLRGNKLCMPELGVLWFCMLHGLRSCAAATSRASDRQPYAQEDPATDDEEGYGSERGSQQRAASSDGGVRSAVTANPESAGGSAAGASGVPADANGRGLLVCHMHVCTVDS